jgi:hypothetical protein
MALDTRTNTAGRFVVTIDGTAVSFMKKCEGFDPQGDIVANDMGPELFQSKHMANFKWGPGKFTVGAGMGKGMWNWIKASFEKGYLRKSGSIVNGDFDYNARTELTFMDALIISVGFPALDASGKDAVYLDVEVEAERVRWAAASGKISAQYGTKQKAWLSPNFRFTLGNLPTERVSKIDAFTWKCAVATDHTGIHREHAKVPAKVTVPDIKFHVSAADAQPWLDASRKWFVDGEHLEQNHMQGRIELLGPDMKKVMAAIELHNCGFKSIKTGALEANSEKVQRVEIEIYLEGLTFSEYDGDA